MLECENLTHTFFKELKSYNDTNFRALKRSDLNNISSKELKAFSSTITRFLIFEEKHPEIPASEMRVLYYRLKLDMVGRYFANYPAASPDELKPFQLELLNYLAETKSA